MPEIPIPAVIRDIQKLQNRVGHTQLNNFSALGETIAATQRLKIGAVERMMGNKVGEIIQAQRKFEAAFGKSFQVGAAAQLAAAGNMANTLAFAEKTAKFAEIGKAIAATTPSREWCEAMSKSAQFGAGLDSSLGQNFRHKGVFKAVEQLIKVGAFTATERLAKAAQVGAAWHHTQDILDEEQEPSNKISKTFVTIAEEVRETITPPPSTDDIQEAASFIGRTMGDALPQGETHDLKESIDAAAESIAQAIEATQKSKLNENIKQILYVVLGVILSQLLSMAFPLSCAHQATTNAEHNNHLRAVKKHVRTCGIDHSKMRIITVRDALNVRQKPNRKSRILGKLPPFAIVTYQDKNNKWVLVRYDDPDSQCAISGWVFSKYLSKIGR